jgi:hypothetical protein
MTASMAKYSTAAIATVCRMSITVRIKVLELEGSLDASGKFSGRFSG